ncbi:MAG: Crp/Fnr family transcriptional regulator [Alphaproteobacteria bacterium]|nr:Crp/Fnr family transcriptional regulator [Alphaproteobacteria bacterium]MDX5369838.1 Crp/Fnr family transcriptional regulator [Alphaproteobacteria bacterium]MDX5464454.1 Crp/Fnr family transcriptional regulator [Alphaproteobacteria bacterium]
MSALRDVRALESVSDPELETLEHYCSWRKYAEDEVILTAGHNDRSDVFFLVEGRARMAVHGGDAGGITFVDLGPGDMFGELAALDENARPITVVALSDCRVAALPHDRFRGCLFEHRYVALYLLSHLATVIRLLSAPAETEGNRSGPRKIYAELLRRCSPDPEHEGQWLVAPVPRSGDLAQACGADASAEDAAITRLASQGVIRDCGHALQVLDRGRLEALVEH